MQYQGLAHFRAVAGDHVDDAGRQVVESDFY
jgi:hypothetical protein